MSKKEKLNDKLTKIEQNTVDKVILEYIKVQNEDKK